MKIIKLTAVLLILIFICGTVQAQYFNETVLEKTFETSDFFFRPSWINPYGLGDFGSTASGLINDPLLNLQLNPAFGAAEASFAGYTYLNFRNTQQKESDNHYYPLWDRSYFIPYPSPAYGGERILEPLISAAGFIQPFKIQSRPVTLGVTYQAILQDGKYQNVSSNIYRSNPGEDYAGNKTSEIADADITDRYSGRDDMHNEGHFLTLFAALPLTEKLALGFRAGLVDFNRNGGLGNTYQWDDGMFENEVSRNATTTARTQDYSHIDVSAGMNMQLSRKSLLGITGGMLTGTADQSLDLESSSLYQSGVVEQTDNWNYYVQEGRTAQTWKHEGRYSYGGFNFSHQISADKEAVFYYRGGYQSTDITLASEIGDSSSSSYHYESTDWHYTSTAESHLFDSRTGTGDKSGWRHQAAAYLRWKTGPKTRVSFGLNVQHTDMTTATSEDVSADQYSFYHYRSQSGDRQHLSSVLEEKTLEWTFTSRVTTIQIPVMLHHRLNDKSEFMFGLTRRMSRWNLTDETLALFESREEIKDGETSKKENFGERYTLPDEIESDVTTSIILGYTLTPSDHLKIRFLTMPQFAKTWNGTALKQFQWWIDFQLVN